MLPCPYDHNANNICRGERGDAIIVAVVFMSNSLTVGRDSSSNYNNDIFSSDFSGDVYEYVINGQWEGVWVHLSFVNIRIYGEIGEGRWRFAFNGVVMESGKLL